MKKIILFFYLLIITSANSQTKLIQIKDSLTNYSVPFSTISFSNNKALITDEYGNFELIINELNPKDSLFVSAIGYEKKSFLNKDIKDSILYILPKLVLLDEVVLSNTKLNSNQIIDSVIAKIEKNYSKDFSKNKIFISQNEKSEIVRFNINKFKSTIEEISPSLIDSITKNLSKNNSSSLETLCYFYGNTDEENQKINLIKARETYNKENDIIQSLNKQLEESFKNNVKSNSYFKIKSGIFGGDLEVDGLDETDSIQTQIDRKNNFAKNQKNKLKNIYSDLFYQTKSPYDFILKPNKYIFSVPKLDFIGDNLVYIIKSSPKGNSKYEATLYIDSEDYAIIRLDFKNVKPIVKFKLLGVSFNYFLKEGKILMSKFNNKNYSLSYIKINGSQNYSIERPIKLIEKNKIVKGRNKQNQISFKLDMKIEQENQIEIQVFNSSFISNEYFKKIEEENKVLPEFIEVFESNFWEDF